MAIGRGGYNTPVLALAGRGGYNKLQQGRGGYNRMQQGRGGYNKTAQNASTTGDVATGPTDFGRGGYN